MSMLAAPDRGSSLIVGDKSHQMKNERGNLSTIANVLPIVLKNAPDGTIPLDLIESYLQYKADPHVAPIRGIYLESSHN